MVKLALFLKATLDGVTDLQPDIPADTPEEYYYSFQVQCVSCRETHPNHVAVSRHEQNEMQGSRGESNFVWKCRNCGRESSANIEGPPAACPLEQSGKKVKMLVFETRGCEFVGFKADGDWMCKGENGKSTFGAIDLGEGEWYDYDDNAGAEVSITEVEWSIERTK
ncbi:hypothetical protein BCR37DRAFT_391424 [Protomyces lactucae-debilis]|uniref:DUF866-domain-containing protein n=1 Tax=Protomyces lactucae-debilis TaxID=2754530 RepID=A0A1Y2FP06_PROLT|nr:uncharacterized protein BCR37DRAFT_391424 [Protomyces lactucae-debilis]ORY85659.1 hypothetical protein BCR37DRAFT_391424 [Protomyces lactucae-debilis]